MLPEAGSRGLFSLASRPLPGPLAGNPVPGAAGSCGANEEPTSHLATTSTTTNPLPYREFTSTATDSRTLEMGRFLSPDKLGGGASRPQGWNRYTYAGNNPLKFVDRTGLDYVLTGCAGRQESTCNQQKALLKETVGSVAYGHLRVGKDGKVTILGSASEFGGFGTFQKGLAALISSRSTFSLVTDNPSMAAKGGGAFTEPLKGGGANTYLDFKSFPQMTGDVLGTAATALVHETGHSLGTLFPALYDRLNRSLGRTAVTLGQVGRGPEGYAVNFEDRYRAEVGRDIRASYAGFGQDVLIDKDTDLVPQQ